MFRNEKLVNAAKILVSLSILAYILFQIDWETSIATIKDAELAFIFAGIFLQSLNRIVINYKQYVLLKARNISLSFWKLFSINMIGAFWGTFLPSSLSTDVVRGVYLVKSGADNAISLSSVVVDRFLGIFSLLVIALIGLLFSGDLIQDNNIKSFIILLTAFLIIFLFVFQLKATSNFVDKLLKFIKFKSIGSKLIKLHRAFLEYKHYPKAIFYSFLLSILVQALRVADIYIIALAFGVEIGLMSLFILVPIIMIVVMVPISIGGIGVREGAFVGFFKLIKIEPSVSIVIAVTASLIATLVALSGGIFYIFYRSDAKKVKRNNKKGVNEEIIKHSG